MPTVWDSSTGKRAMTAPELSLLEADQVAHISRRREQRRAAFKAEAGARIRAVLGTDKEGEDLLIYQINLGTRAQQLQRKEALGTASTAEVALLDTLDAARDDIEAVRDAENAASALLDNAGIDTNDTIAQRIAEIDAVTATWPS
jgi:hypothetical protein